MEKLGSNRKSYWDHAEYITERIREGQTLTSVAEELSISKDQASRFKKAYELYVLEYGITIEALERISIYDLYNAQGKALQLVKDKKSAEHLVNLLQNGKDFNAIRKEAKVASKPRTEHMIEGIEQRLKILKVPKGSTVKLTNIVKIVEKYHGSITECRENPIKSERLLVDCFAEIANLYLET